MRVDAIACDGPGAARIGAMTRPYSLSAEDFVRQRPSLSFVASSHSVDRACASIWWNEVPSLPNQRVGIVGHYAAANGEAGIAVLEAACAALRAQGVTHAVGPMDASTWHRYRLVTWRSAEPRFLLEPDNPDDWPQHFTRAGFDSLAGYHSSCCDDIAAIAPDTATAARLAAEGFRLRTFDPSRPDLELHALYEVACDAFAHNFLYTPIGEEEFRRISGTAIAIAPPGLTTIVERDGRMVGFVFSYPDTLRAARGEPVDTVVVKSAGVIAGLQCHGLGQLLFDAMIAGVRAAGYRRVIYALMHDANVSTHFGRDTRRVIRRYTLYSRPL
jgi:L-amino acid N-acyltransferase YncA